MVLFTDTSLDAEAVQLELFKQASPAKRFALMSSFSSTLRKASLQNLEQRFPQARARPEWVRLHYGEKWAQRLQDKLTISRSTVNETKEALQPLILSFKTPEDVILGKLEWFVHTDRTSDRQWRDILGLLKVQGSALDVD